MEKTYCAWCGSENPTTPCATCRHTGKTAIAPSQEPCAYCGKRPTWPVAWQFDEKQEIVWLCAECDEQETKECEE